MQWKKKNQNNKTHQQSDAYMANPSILNQTYFTGPVLCNKLMSPVFFFLQ